MKKTFVVLIIVLVVALICFFVFYEKAEAPNLVVPEETEEEVEVKELSFVISSKQIREETYEVDFKFPVTGEQKIDTEIMQYVEDTVDSFEVEAKSFSPHPSLSERKYTLFSDVKTHFGKKYDTFEFLISVDFGGAHPNHFYKTITFDKNQNQVSLQEILNSEFNGESSLEVISKLTREYLYEKLGEGVNPQMIDEGTKASFDNYKNFYLTEDQIVFLFEPYAVAPYAYSSQEVSLDFSEIKN